MKKSLSILPILFLIANQLFALAAFIYTKEGRQILKRKPTIDNCLRSLKKDKTDATALAICECRINKIDRHFTNKQYKKFTNASNMIDISAMIAEDSLFNAQVDACYTGSGKTILLQAEGFEQEFINDCLNNVVKNTEKQLDTNRVKDFCRCQLGLVKSKKLTDAEMATLSNPNSILFYAMISECGDPFSAKDLSAENWSEQAEKDIEGPASDSIKIFPLNGMTYMKIKIGNQSQIWLFDTGASDLLINTETEETLKTEGIITEKNYLGIGEYEMANGMIDTCRKYRIDNVKIGGFTVNNITVAVTEKGKRIIVGKALLNKFGNWVIDNKKNVLVLTK